jgi:hypothetical protein
MRQGLTAIRITPQGTIASWDQSGRGFGIAAGEERDVVAQPHEFFGQVGNDAFCPAI